MEVNANYMMERQIIPLNFISKSAITPVFDSSANVRNRYVYKIYSSVSAKNIFKHENTIKTGLRFILPVGVKCQKKSIYFMEGENLIHDHSYQRGITDIPEDEEITLSFNIYCGMDTSEINVGQMLGALIFEKEIEFKKH